MQLDLDFIRSQFPAFSEPALAGQSFFENAGGSFTCRQVIDRLFRFYNERKVQPYENRLRAWERIANDLPMDKLEAMIQPATLGDLPALGKDILKGQVKGRVVVDVNA